jgi:hypothetical protein
MASLTADSLASHNPCATHFHQGGAQNLFQNSSGRQEVKYQEFLNLTYVGCKNKKARRAPPAHSGTYVGYITGTNN